MRNIFAIAHKEFTGLFKSFSAYIFFVLYFGICGFYTWFSDSNIFITGQGRLDIFFQVSFWSLFFLIPAITMRSIADEKRAGTFDLLLLKPVNYLQIILGKFLAYLCLILLVLFFTILYYITLSSLGTIDNGAVIGGYIALVLLSATFISIGIFASSITKNSIIAFIISLSIGFFFIIVINQLYALTSGIMRLFFVQLNFNTHFDSLSRGVINLKDIVFFCSCIIIFIFASCTVIAKKTDTLFSSSRLLIIFTGLLLLNYMSALIPVRYDATTDKRYTLCDATLNILSKTKDPVSVKFYFTKNIHPNFDRIGEEFSDLLYEYENNLPNRFSYKVINPSTEKEIQQVIDEGINPLMVNVNNKDKVNVQKAYMTAVVTVGDTSEIIPLIKPGTEMEYELTSAIYSLSSKHKPIIAFVSGHGEPPVTAFKDVYRNLVNQYQIEEIALNDSIEIPLRVKTIVIIDPRDTFPPLHLQQLNNFISHGGNIFIALSRTQSNLEDLFIDPLTTTGLELWLKTKGIYILTNNVVDAHCGKVLVQQQQDQYMYNSELDFHYYPIFTNFAKHTITSGLEKVLMTCPSTIQLKNKQQGFTYTPLLFSSEQSGSIMVPVQIELTKKWGSSDFPLAHIPVAVAVEKSDKILGSRMVVIANGTFVTNGHNGIEELNADNVNLAVNSIDWLSDETKLIELRNKSITSFTLKQTTDSERTFLKFINMILPYLFSFITFLLYVIIVKRKKLKWQKGIY